ncbi:MAG: tetratricopeptide repeat protein, partial [Thermoplasmata archaeon]
VGAWATKVIPRVDQTTPGLRTAIVGTAAFQATFLADFDRAIELSQQALADGIPPNCPAPGQAYSAWSIALTSRGEPRVALEVMLDGLEKLEAAGADDYTIGGVHVLLATAAAASQDPALARAHADQAVGIARRSGIPSTLAIALFALGESLALSDPGTALTSFEESAAVMRSGASDIVLGPALGEIGLLRARAGDAEGAITALQEAVIHVLDDSYRPIVAGTLDRCVHSFASLELDELAAVLAGVISEGALAGMGHYFDSSAAQRQAALERVRGRLGDDEYERALRRGSGLVYEEVVQYTRQLFDDLARKSLAPGERP